MAESAAEAPERLSGDERRSALLDVTKDIVLEHGSNAVTMGSVAERAEVTRALVYKHFENKDELLLELYRREARILDRHIRRAVVAAPAGFEPKLRAFIGAALDAAEEHGPFFAPLRGVGRNREVRDEQREWDRRTSRYWIAQAIDEFGVDREVAAAAIGVLFSGMSSLLSQMRARPGPERRQFLEDVYVELTLGALGRLGRFVEG